MKVFYRQAGNGGASNIFVPPVRQKNNKKELKVKKIHNLPTATIARIRKKTDLKRQDLSINLGLNWNAFYLAEHGRKRLPGNIIKILSDFDKGRITLEQAFEISRHNEKERRRRGF